jgi:hypothetical protein
VRGQRGAAKEAHCLLVLYFCSQTAGRSVQFVRLRRCRSPEVTRVWEMKEWAENVSKGKEGYGMFHSWKASLHAY